MGKIEYYWHNQWTSTIQIPSFVRLTDTTHKTIDIAYQKLCVHISSVFKLLLAKCLYGRIEKDRPEGVVATP